MTIVAAMLLTGAVAAEQGMASPNGPQDVCISALRNEAIIRFGRGKKRFELILGGGVCGPREPLVSTMLAAAVNSDDGTDAVLIDDCPALRARLAMLPSGLVLPDRARSPRPVRVGPFRVTGGGRLFDLRSLRGRTVTERWIRATLVAVQPCWNSFRQDRTRHVVDRLYADPAIAVYPRATRP